MRSTFPLFQSHLDLAHDYWKRLVKPNDIVIDATCGNGHDTLHLSQLIDMNLGKVYSFDIQPAAIAKAKELTQHHSLIHYEVRCHSTFPSSIPKASVKLIVYNLGYLPGGDKNLTTTSSSTLQSLQNALELIMPGGAISMTCYPGHPAGALEEKALVDFVKELSPQKWNICHQQWVNRQASPSLLILQKADDRLIT